MAIKEWAKLSNGGTVPLERALAAFDMFVVHERDGDFHDVCIQEWYSFMTAKRYRWLLILTVSRDKSAAIYPTLWINRPVKKPSHWPIS